MAKFDPFLSLDCARVEGVGAQSKERKGSNFAAQRSGAIVQKPTWKSPKGQTHTIYKSGYSHLATMIVVYGFPTINLEYEPAVKVEQAFGEGVANLLEHTKHRADGDEGIYHGEELVT